MKLASFRSLLLPCVFLVAVLFVATVAPAAAPKPAGEAVAEAPAGAPAATAEPSATAPAAAAEALPTAPAATAQPLATAPAATAEPVATAEPRAAAPIAIGDTYYYRYQGGPDSGACASANCGPAVFAAAIGYAKGTWLAIKDVREYLSGDSCRGTDYSDAYRALDHWGVDYETTSTMAELKTAVSTRGHPVLAILLMGYISPGADYLHLATDPAQHFGRFHDYTDGHMVVVKGFTEDGEWVIVDDPYVFDGGRGFYSDGTPKGHNRYLPYAEFEKAFRYFGFQGIEIIPDQASE